MWLADMHYRVAARQQEVAWQDISALMTRLFARLREIEINRKTVTKELLAATVSVMTWCTISALQRTPEHDCMYVHVYIVPLLMRLFWVCGSLKPTVHCPDVVWSAATHPIMLLLRHVTVDANKPAVATATRCVR